jgi:hypothetical protein
LIEHPTDIDLTELLRPLFKRHAAKSNARPMPLAAPAFFGAMILQSTLTGGWPAQEDPSKAAQHLLPE